VNTPLNALAKVTQLSDGSYLWLLVEMVAILALVCLVAYVLLRLLAGSPLARQRGPIQVLARQSLEPRRSVFVLSAGHRVLLVGSSEAGLNTLAELDASDLEAMGLDRSDEPDTNSFAARMAAKLAARKPKEKPQ